MDHLPYFKYPVIAGLAVFEMENVEEIPCNSLGSVAMMGGCITIKVESYGVETKIRTHIYPHLIT